LNADDTNLFIHGTDKNYVFEKANEYLKLLNNWFVANKLSINHDKTCYTVFGLKDYYYYYYYYALGSKSSRGLKIKKKLKTVC